MAKMVSKTVPLVLYRRNQELTPRGQSYRESFQHLLMFVLRLSARPNDSFFAQHDLDWFCTGVPVPGVVIN
jgi:hypothetical protein